MIWKSDGDERVSDTVDIDTWWRAMESKMIEAAVYKDAKIEPIVAASIAPWIPPSCHGNMVNTEHRKSKNSQVNSSATPIGGPKTLAELIRRGTYNPLDLQALSVHNLQEICTLVGIPYKQTTTKVGIPTTVHVLCTLNDVMMSIKHNMHH